MRVGTMLSLVTIAVLCFNGCGGGSSSPTPEKEVNVEGIGGDEYNVKVCTEKTKGDEECKEANVLDLNENTVAVLSAPEDIGVSPFSAYEGKRYLVVSKGETEINMPNVLAWGIAQQGNTSYEEAKKQLENVTKEQKNIFFNALNHNVEELGNQGLPLDQAYKEGLKAIVIGEWDSPPSLYSVSEEDCVLIKYGECVKWFDPDMIQSETTHPNGFFLDIDKAADIALKVRTREGKPNRVDELFERISCKENEDKKIYMYGVADNFITTNSEPTNPRPALLSELSALFPGYINSYDYFAAMYNPNVFAETISNLPTNLTQGMIVFGLKEEGMRYTNIPSYIDRYSIGSGVQNTANATGAVSDIRANWSGFGADIYYKDLSQIANSSGQSLLTRVQSGQNYLDISFGITTNVDFIAVATCSPKDKPTGIPVIEIPEKLGCNIDKGESLEVIWGGIGDDFALPIDPATPPSILLNSNSLIAYDEIGEKRVGIFGDRIALPNFFITKANLLINTKATAQGSSNDTIFFGDFLASKFGYHNPNDNGIATLNGGTAHIIDDSESISNTNSDLLSLLNSGISHLDVAVLNQTMVDSIRLSMCVVKEPKGGDIAIEKKLIEQYSKGDLNYGIFEISFSGTLPTNETIVVQDIVPNDASITHINASPWVCTPTPIISGGSTLNCSLTGLYSPIPPINLTMQTKEHNITNCASIVKGTETYYNDNPENDKSCDNMTFDDIVVIDPKECNQQIRIDLSQATTWRDNSGNHPTQNNGAIPAVWDNSYNWFYLGSAQFTDYVLKSEDFCSCGGGTVNVEGLKTDNKGYIDLNNLDANSAVRIAEKTINSSSTMASWGSPAFGTANFPHSGNGVNYQLELGVHNFRGLSGAAVKGVLEFIGHKGLCTDDDITNDDVLVLEAERVVASLLVESNDTIPGGFVIEPMDPFVRVVDGFIDVEEKPIPIVVKVKKGEVRTVASDEFTGPIPFPLPSNIMIKVGCDNGFYRIAWLDEGGYHSYTSDISCGSNWSASF